MTTKRQASPGWADIGPYPANTGAGSGVTGPTGPTGPAGGALPTVPANDVLLGTGSPGYTGGAELSAVTPFGGAFGVQIGKTTTTVAVIIAGDGSGDTTTLLIGFPFAPQPGSGSTTVAGADSTNAHGGNTTLVGGVGANTFDGGLTSILGGNNNAAAVTGNGGAVEIIGGTARSGSGRSGPVTIASGQANGSSTGDTGPVQIVSGTANTNHNTGLAAVQSGDATGTGTSGAVSLEAGNTQAGTAGSASVIGGTSTAGTGGDAHVQAGGGSDASHSGSVLLQDGSSNIALAVDNSNAAIGNITAAQLQAPLLGDSRTADPLRLGVSTPVSVTAGGTITPTAAQLACQTLLFDGTLPAGTFTLVLPAVAGYTKYLDFTHADMTAAVSFTIETTGAAATYDVGTDSGDIAGLVVISGPGNYLQVFKMAAA